MQKRRLASHGMVRAGKAGGDRTRKVNHWQPVSDLGGKGVSDLFHAAMQDLAGTGTRAFGDSDREEFAGVQLPTEDEGQNPWPLSPD